MNIVAELISALRDKDAGRARSKQTQVGPSELGSCARKVWYRLQGQEPTNENELKLAAIMGTAIHTEIEAALRKKDPEGKTFILESEVAYGDMKAHVDCYLPEEQMIVDWKTVKSKTLGYFPSRQQRWQVQVYGYLMIHGAKKPVKKVALVAISRDGDERDVIMHEEPYDESIALEALSWLEAIKDSHEPPAPEKDAISYCQSYCRFYDATGEKGCVGLKKADAPMVQIKESFVDEIAHKYLQVDNEIKILTKEKDALRSELEGHVGTTESGIQIAWTPIAGRRTVDSDEVEKLLGFIPYKVGKDTSRLDIKSLLNKGGIELDGE